MAMDFSFNYPNSPYTFTTGMAVDISVNVITSNGQIPYYKIASQLPYSLIINSITGEITNDSNVSPVLTFSSVTPLTVYTVDASFASAIVSTQLSMSVNYVPGFVYTESPYVVNINNPITPIVPVQFFSNLQGISYSNTSVAKLIDINLILNPSTGVITGTPLSTLKQGTYIIQADNGGITYDASLNISVLRLPSIVYHDSNYTLSQGKPVDIFPLFYSLQPNVVYDISCSLPDGLIFNTLTGQITGAPTLLSKHATYRVTITNVIGSAMTQFVMNVIKIFLAPPVVSDAFSSGLCLTEPSIAMRRKAEILKYKKNSATLTKNQQFSLGVQGHGPYGNRSWANQNTLGSNPNTSGLPQQGNTIVCNSPAVVCSPTSSSDVPGPLALLCYDPTVPLVGYVAPNRKKVNIGFKWPEQSWSPGANGFPVGKAGNTVGNVVEVPLFTVPSAPTILYSNVTSISAIIYFTPPADDGSGSSTSPSTSNTAIVNYLYAIDGGITFTLLSPAQVTSPLTIPNLISGKTYDIVIAAFDLYGASGFPSNTITVTIGNFLPGAPTITSTSVSDGAASISFTPSMNNGGTIITNYKYSIDGGATFTSAGQITSPILITGLSNGTSYVVKLKAVNIIGDGAASNAVTVTPMTSPSAPTINSIAVGDSIVVMTFTAPLSTGGSAITNYNYSIDGGASFTSAGQITSPITITGLTNGTTYSIVLQAVNGVGHGASSAPPLPAVPIAVPRAPTNLSATVSDRAALISFTAPDDGGSPIIAYQYSLDGGTTFITAAEITSPLQIAGLTNGTTYSVVLRARSSVGNGTASNALAVTPLTVPDAPVIVYDTVTTSSATIYFTQPSNTSGSAILYYKASIDYGLTFFIAGVASPITLLDLSNGSTYYVQLQAVNSVGPSIVVQTVPITIGQIGPDAPTITSGTVGDSLANIFFTPPINHGKSIINNYYYYLGPVGPSDVSYNAASTTSPILITGLTNGTTYHVRLQAINSDAVGQISTPPYPITPLTTPSAPTNLVATALNSAIDISFTPPLSTGGSPITDYKYSIDGGVTFTSSGQVISPIRVTGLVNGTPYQIKLRAVNAQGDGLATSPALTVTPFTTASPPFIYFSIVSDTSCNIYFAQSSNGGSTITQYNYYIHDFSNNTDFSNNSYPVTTSPITITGLTKFHTYSLYLKAVNAAGLSGASNTNIFIPGQIGPSAPTNLSAIVSSGAAAISFTAPLCNGNGPLTTYYYYVDDTISDISYNANTLLSPITVPNLINGTTYMIKLQAENNVPALGELSTSIPVIPMTIPSAPINLSAISHDSALDISFNQSIIPYSGSAISNYNYSINGGASFSPFSPAQTSSPVTITGLTNGTTYQVVLQAVNAAGPSANSAAVLGTPLTIPSAPVIVSAAVGKDQALDISFNIPYNGGSPITKYYYYLQYVDVSYNAIGLTSPITVAGLTNGTLYYIQLKAVNAVGVSALSNDISAVPMTFPVAPTGLSATVSDVSANIYFTQVNTSGSAITNYQYSYNGGLTFSLFDPSQNSSPIKITGLTRDHTYSILLKSLNAIGLSGASTPLLTFTTWALPGLPAITGAVGINGGANISFNQFGDGGTAILSYNYYVYYDASGQYFVLSNNTNTTTSPLQIVDLSNGTQYYVQLQAINAVGAGSRSALFGPVIPRTVPNAPFNVTASMTDGGVDISFNSPYNGGSAITNYSYSINGGTYNAISPPTITSPITISLAGLNNLTTYSLTLKAINAAGSSAASSPVTTFTVALAGTYDFTFDISNGFYWTTPTDNGQVYCLTLDANGYLIVGGAFQRYYDDGINHRCNCLARLASNGTLDSTFITGSGFTFGVLCSAVNPSDSNSKIVLGGSFNTYNDVSCNYIARLSSTGVFDTAFNTALGTGFDKPVYAIGWQVSSGNLIVGGAFSSFNGYSCNSIARLQASGSLDLPFQTAIGSGFDNYVYAVAVATFPFAGRIIAGGAFTHFNGSSCNSITRLLSSGSLDLSFNAVIGSGFNGPVACVVLQINNGKILVGGAFTQFNGIPCNSIARLNTDGTLDTSFTSGSGFNNKVTCIAIQPHTPYQIIVGGSFTMYNGLGCNSIARLNASNGSLDTSFNTRAGFISYKNGVRSVAVQSGIYNYNVFVGGDFIKFNKVLSNSIARIYWR
jgi:uncharacterized delta-60 repeat protein